MKRASVFLILSVKTPAMQPAVFGSRTQVRINCNAAVTNLVITPILQTSPGEMVKIPGGFTPKNLNAACVTDGSNHSLYVFYDAVIS